MVRWRTCLECTRTIVLFFLRCCPDYKVSKKKLEELIEIKEKLISTNPFLFELSKSKLVGVEGMDELSDLKESIKIVAIDNLSNDDWRKSIVNLLENPTGSTDRKFKYKALSYMIIGNELFKKTPDGILLKCLSESEAHLAISAVHSGACGAHQAGHKMKWLLVRQGLYWLTMLKNCIEY